MTGKKISIHAPHAGSDLTWAIFWKKRKRFQSTLPMRGATIDPDMQVINLVFQSTLPMRGATRREKSMASTSTISIHAPHAGSDKGYQKWLCKN